MIAPSSQLTTSKSEVFCEKKPKWRDTTKRYIDGLPKKRNHALSDVSIFGDPTLPKIIAIQKTGFMSKTRYLKDIVKYSSFPWLHRISPPSEPRKKKKHGLAFHHNYCLFNRDPWAHISLGSFSHPQHKKPAKNHRLVLFFILSSK